MLMGAITKLRQFNVNASVLEHLDCHTGSLAPGLRKAEACVHMQVLPFGSDKFCCARDGQDLPRVLGVLLASG